MILKASVWLIILATFMPQLLTAQAAVNESLETSFLYVDAAKGSDFNPGTQSQPLKTISAASAIANVSNYHSIGTHVFINPGLYRETVSIMGNQYNTALPVTFEGVGKGAIISGAVPYTNWQSYSGNAAVYTAPWANKWGFCPANADGTSPFEQEIVLRREMIFVNGSPLTQVLTLGQMQSGTFAVSETANMIYIWPAVGVDIGTADVEF